MRQGQYSTATSARLEASAKSFISNKSKKSKWSLIKLDNDKFTGLYKTVADANTLLAAYSNLKSKPGYMTKSGTEELLGKYYFHDLEAKLKDGSFQFKPARRVHIKKLRPLGIPSARDQIVQEAMRMVLEAIYERHGHFSDLSHGFRPNRGCHSALKEISK